MSYSRALLTNSRILIYFSSLVCLVRPSFEELFCLRGEVFANGSSLMGSNERRMGEIERF